MRKLLLTLLLIVSVSVAAVAAKPKYIFLFIGDGMGMGHVMAAENYNRLVRGSQDNILMMQFPVASFAMTYSTNSPVTDSAAAGTALACGTKTNNGMVGMNADTVAVTSVASELKAKYGYGVGIVTSVAYDDATPATHYAHQPKRGMYEQINRDGARSGFDFIAGAGTHLGDKKETRVKIDAAFEDFRNNGYSVIKGINALKKENPKGKVLLTVEKPVNNNEIGYAIDSIEGATSLKELTVACLDHLQKVSPKGFYMMVEAGNIDHAAHGNDGGTVVKEIINFQEAIQVAYDFYLQHPKETLIVVTADHDTGGMTVGVKGGPWPITLKYLDYQRISKERFSDLVAEEKDRDWEDMKELIADKLGLFDEIPVDYVEEAKLMDCYGRMKANIAKSTATLYKEFNAFAEAVFDLLNHKNGFGFTTYSHTGNPVPVFAVGAGSEMFKDLNNNQEIPCKFRKLTGLKK